MASGGPWFSSGLQYRNHQLENAFAAQYQIQWTNEDPATNPTWNVATTNNAGAGGTETLTFNTVQARYIRVLGTLRSGNFGYSIYEVQVYNVPTCGGPTERYTISSANTNLVMDNVLGLTWTRTIQTDTAVGSQFTGVSAVAYCNSINMRIPTETEALGISGNNNASCAFKGSWSTWTSTLDPNDATETAIVNFDGSSTFNVTNNFPGATLCTVATGSSVPSTQAPVIQTRPQPTTVSVGQAATLQCCRYRQPCAKLPVAQQRNPNRRRYRSCLYHAANHCHR
jgi:beta-galactosidase